VTAYSIRAARRLTLALTLTIAAFGPATALADPPNTADPGAYVPNNDVLAVAHAGGKTFIGGSFDEVGPFDGNGVRLDPASGAKSSSFPLIGGGAVNASISDGNGGVFLGGTFTRVNGVDRQGLVHVLADGTVDPAFTGHAGGQVYALAYDSTREVLYIGGSFSQVGNQSSSLGVDNLAAYDLSADAPLNQYAPDPSSTVYALGLDAINHVLYVGGVFTTLGSNSQARALLGAVVAADPTSMAVTGAATAWDPHPTGGAYIFAIRLAGGLSPTKIYVGGFFASIGTNTAARSNAAALDTGGAALAWDPGPDSWVRAFAVSGSTVYLGGEFDNIASDTGTPVAAAGLAAVDNSNGAPVSGFQANIAPSTGYPKALAVGGSPQRLYVGGTFSGVGGTTRHNLAAVDLATGAVSAFDPSPGSTVSALSTFSGTTIVAGGDFTSLAPGNRYGVAALDGDGKLLPWTAPTTPLTTGVKLAASPDGSLLYMWSQPGTASPVPALAALSVADGSLHPWATTDGTIYDIVPAPDGHTVYLAGSFDHVDGQPRANLAAVDAQTGALMPWRPDPDNGVNAVAVDPSGSPVYVAGAFTHVGPGVDARSGLAALSPDTGAPTSWVAGSGIKIDDLMVAPDGQHVYAIGDFTTLGANAASRLRLGQLTASTGNATGFDGQLSSQGLALAQNDDGSAIYAAGTWFTTIAGVHPGLLGLDNGGSGLAWTPEAGFIGGSLSDFYALAAEGETVWAGGHIALTANSGDGRPFYAQWSKAPVASATPVVSGTAVEGATVSCTAAVWRNAPAHISYAWLLNGAPVSGAAGDSFSLPPGSGGQSIACEQTASNPGGSATARSADVAVAVPTVEPPVVNPPAGSPLPAVKDLIAPVLSKLRLVPATFKVGPRRTALSARKVAKGTSIRLVVSEPATVTFTVLKGKKPAGKFTRKLKAGSRKVAFSGRIGKKALGPGRYALRVQAKDAAGNKSRTKTLKFRVVR
jgi:Domain of unknown function (DUF5122) beta-propeller